MGERWVHDPDAPAILECCNWVYMPPVVPLYTHFRNGGNFSASMKYAFSNYPIITEFGTTEGPHAFQDLQETRGYEPSGGWGLDSVYYGIGYSNFRRYDDGERKVSIPPIIPPVKTITTQSWRNPHVGTIWRPDPDDPSYEIVGDGWFSNSGWTNIYTHRPRWGTDYVMWVYDWEWRLDGELLRFDPIASLTNLPRGISLINAGVNDGLFLPGQIGARVISRKFWDAPWERYPHL